MLLFSQITSTHVIKDTSCFLGRHLVWRSINCDIFANGERKKLSWKTLSLYIVQRIKNKRLLQDYIQFLGYIVDLPRVYPPKMTSEI